ncbi:hypothetical protein NPIL_485251 [Nephila pilipes]|uniref:Uncharacterized protein n=1 Tax=Nephila pilipes TaxID=299642 RepID=A0A8X6MQK4_NEPPI|nr:hypothetical protein NPIL_485231 [Nephila pilipes]GFS72549.1 hypothetical protein NPIL_485251 [Nephila pilipes]
MEPPLFQRRIRFGIRYFAGREPLRKKWPNGTENFRSGTLAIWYMLFSRQHTGSQGNKQTKQWSAALPCYGSAVLAKRQWCRKFSKGSQSRNLV